MKLLMLSCASLLFLATGCTTKVYNQQPESRGNPTVIERERVIEKPQQPDKTDVNIHVDHD
jgi:hypothetical protein